MIKFYKQVDIKQSDLILAFNSAGLAGNFASSLLINNNSFENVGFLFSHYLSSYASNANDGQITYNAEVYFNQEKKTLLINFFAGVSHYFKDKFFEELMQIYETNQMGRLFIIGGIGKGYLNDEELRKAVIDTYYLTNDTSFNGESNGLKCFEKLAQISNKSKPLAELKYIDNSGTAKHLVKWLSRKNYKFYYLFVFSSALFDPLAGAALYFKLSQVLGLRSDSVTIPKNYENILKMMEELSKQLKIDPAWKLFLKE